MTKNTNRLRVLRAERRVSQMDAAAASNMTQNRFWKIENGYAEATAKERAALAKTFGVEASDIFHTADQAKAS